MIGQNQRMSETFQRMQVINVTIFYYYDVLQLMHQSK